MSDSTQGPGWWQASDGKWYPPESHPDAAPHVPPPPAAPMIPPAHAPSPQIATSPVPNDPRKPWWRRWWAIALGVLILLFVIAAIASPDDDEADGSVEVAPAADVDDEDTDDTDGGETDEPAVVATTTGDASQDTAPTNSTPPTDTSTEPTSAATEPTTAPTEPPPVTTVLVVTTPAPEPEPLGGRDNPVPVGQPTTITMDTFGDADNSQWTLRVDGPGSDMTQAVVDENMFNEPPDQGTLFYGVPVTLTLDRADKEPLSIFFNLSFEFFGPSSLSIISDGFSEGCGVTPGEFDILKEVFVGGSVSGVVCYQVSNEDAAGGILLTLDSIEGDRIFLATR